MSTLSHVAGWPSAGPTAAQLKEFFTQIESGRITKDNLQGFLREPEPDEEQEVSAPGITTRTILAPLYKGTEIMVAETDGSETMAKAEKVFDGYLDPNFKKWDTDEPSAPTKTQAVTVYELRQDARFAKMFSSLGDLDKLVMTQSQIIRFCVDHRDKLRQEGYATFFLFKAGEEYFVADVRVDGGGLKAYVSCFGHDFVWYGGSCHRVVVPQL